MQIRKADCCKCCMETDHKVIAHRRDSLRDWTLIIVCIKCAETRYMFEYLQG